MKRLMLACALLLATLPAQAAPFTLTDTGGVTHTLDGYRGKWVLVNAWATWCGPCIVEMPELEAFSRAHAGEAVVLGMAVDGQDERRVLRFAERLRVTYPIVAADRAALSQFALRAYPTTFVYDPAGRQVLVKEGKVTRAELEALLAAPR